MSDEFDPYLEWLGIPADQRPPDHYALLGLNRFETDPGVILDAANRRMLEIRKYQTGPRSLHTQPLLNDLAAAKLCLLNAESKTIYDAELRKSEAASRAESDPPDAKPWSPQHVSPTPSVAAHTAPFGIEPHVDFNEDELVDDETDDALNSILVPALLILGVAFVTLLLAVVLVFVVKKRDEVRARKADAEQSGDVTPGDFVQPKEKRSVDDDADQPVVVNAEADGHVELSAGVARLAGGLTLVIRDGENAIAGWSDPEDAASWRFKVLKNGIYRVQVSYTNTAKQSAGTLRFRIGPEGKSHELRASDPMNETVTDELFLPVRRAGVNSLVVETDSPAVEGEIEIRGIQLSLP